jgi:arsenate reductase
MTKKILLLCTGNSCRSQIAHGYLQKFANGKADVYSAGVETHGVNFKAIAIMKEDGIDISNHTSNHIDEYRNIDFDFVITVYRIILFFARFLAIFLYLRALK